MKARIIIFVGLCLLAAAAWGQNSNGSDGALNITAATPGVVNGVLVFDPRNFNPPLDADGDNVYHFTTVNIDGVTVKLRAKNMRLPGPVVWLASGDVTITGALDLSGENGYTGGVQLSQQAPSEPGPGGFPGGLGARAGGQPQPGRGPGGGAVPATSVGCAGGYATSVPHSGGTCAGGGGAYGSTFVQPLIGGSGGSGGLPCTSWSLTNGPGGGAGGGAIRIRSATQIVGNVSANGGGAANDCGYTSGPGSGGAVHLQAPSVATNVFAQGGSGGGEAAQPGRIRIDSDQPPGGGQSPPALVGPFTGVNVPLPVISSVRVVSVNGVAAPAVPTGLYTIPDIQINTSNAVPIVIAAKNIPLGTVVTLYISSADTGLDTTATTSALTGTLADSTATANLTLPAGVSRIHVRATW